MPIDGTRWTRSEEVFHAALDQPREARAAFLDRACAGDDEMRRQVALLLEKDDVARSFLERPAHLPGTALRDATGARGALVGRQLGTYEIASFLGAGGMGEVYRAHDTKLGRDVAIKTLPPAFARDPVRLERFRREARILASLNHPNIAAIYGLEEAAGVDYLVLELVDGETLHGRLPLTAALECACQLAEALEAAHDHGVIHRDLKPANVKLTPRGLVKVLDFGVAKSIAGPADAAPAPPATEVGTLAGQIVGTPGYMSPEQARGHEVDQRADIWAIGCFVYELLSGERAFKCETVTDTAAAVLVRDPQWKALPPGTPARLRALLRACLQKDPCMRPQRMADVRAVLEAVRRRGQRGSADGAGAAGQRGRRLAERRIHALAVLPLVNLGGDPDQEYFADGMTEALIAELAQIRALRVTSRTSAMRYKGTAMPLPAIGRELNVDAVVEGSVRRAGDRVRVSAQLVHAATDRHLWARSYERDARDVLSLQTEVARAIAEEIQVTLTPKERVRLERTRPVNVEAHEAYIRGRYHWGRVHPERSIEHFRRAIQLDPTYAEPYAGIADAQCLIYGAAMELVPPEQIAPSARAAALEALELDASLAEPHATLARVGFWYDRDAAYAERELRLAIRLNPNCATAHFHLAILLADLGRYPESVSEFAVALQLDPVSCWNVSISGLLLWNIGKEEEGRQHLQRALELDPAFYFTWSSLSLVQAVEGRFDEAVATAREGVRVSGGMPVAVGWEGYVLGMAGRHAEARGAVDTLEALSRERHVPAISRVWCFLGLGDYDRALEWLDAGYEGRDTMLPHVGVFRQFAPLYREPRFRDLLGRLGLPETPAGQQMMTAWSRQNRQ
jgi:TolB-like protein/Tfp pilus assembly protein PilF